MERLRSVEVWVAIISAIVALGFINADQAMINEYAAQIVASIAVLGTLFDTVRRLIS